MYVCSYQSFFITAHAVITLQPVTTCTRSAKPRQEANHSMRHLPKIGASKGLSVFEGGVTSKSIIDFMQKQRVTLNGVGH